MAAEYLFRFACVPRIILCMRGHINNNPYINNMWFCISARSSFDLHIRPATAQLTCFSNCLLTLEPSYCSCYKENCIALSLKRARSVYKNALVLVRLLSCTRQRSVHSIFTLTWYKTACMRYPLHPPTPPNSPISPSSFETSMIIRGRQNECRINH